MKNALAALLILATALDLPAAAASPEDEAIREAVNRAYVQGIHQEQDTEKVRAGFDESFIMFIRTDGGVDQLSRDAWIERIEASKAKAQEGPKPKTTADVTVLDVTGDAAVVKVDLFRDGKQVFTDYISLYKTAGGWKLVGKIYQRHS